MKMKIEKILISDPVDEAAIQILRERNIHCDLRPGLPKNELITIIKVVWGLFIIQYLTFNFNLYRTMMH